MINKKLSFCITCRNRSWQLKKTLANNLSHIDEDTELCLVDFGSSDGLSDWIWSNFRSHIESGKLQFFEVKTAVRWNCAKAKNLAHRISTGSYLFNLDADNFIGKADLILIYEAMQSDSPCWQYSNDLLDGSYGRIGVPRDIFFALGGYDEGMLPMGGQDYDLLNRLSASNIKILRIPAPEIRAIDNKSEHKTSEVTLLQNSPEITYNVMNNFNVRRSKFRLDLEGAVISGGFSSFQGLLNGNPVLIDGFNNFYRLNQ